MAALSGSTLVDAPTTSRQPAKVVADKACVDAVDVARSAAVDDFGAANVGDHIGHEVDGERLVTHSFACLLPGYNGWRWAVTVARASRSKLVTVDETCLLPGIDAMLAPAWVPWSERLQPGDLGVGDLLPTAADDARLLPGYTGADESADAVRDLVWELGLGRPRVLSPYGVEDAADRWVNGNGGPQSALALAAPAHCDTCGFFVKVQGRLGQHFGACANAFSPSDGHVVSVDHGCGAHSEAVVTPVAETPSAPVADSLGYDDLGHS